MHGTTIKVRMLLFKMTEKPVQNENLRALSSLLKPGTQHP